MVAPAPINPAQTNPAQINPAPTNSALADRLRRTDAAIADAATRAGRDPGDLTRIVITKYQPVSVVRHLAGLGVCDVGENRQQELSKKTSDGELRALRWHFVGQLQTNKAAAVRRVASAVHSVDRGKLVTALDRAADSDDVLDVFVQVNLTPDGDRGGISAQDAPALAEHVAQAQTLRLLGVMAVAPLGEDPRRAFERLAVVAERVRDIVPTATAISAGMSSDLAPAIEFGATHLRIGSAITGPRPSHQ